MKAQVGTRVGAILSATSDTVHFLGYGVYDGEHEPPFGPFGMPKEEHDKIINEMKSSGQLPADYAWKNPRITLDDGRIVWGTQCWWGPEETIRQKIGSRHVVNASID